MFNNRSFTVVVTLALLALVTLIFGTAVGGAPTGKEASDTASIIPARSKGYAELKEAQLERRDTEQFGGASILVAGEDETRSMQKEQRAAIKSIRGTDVAAPVQVRPKSYAELKEAQLEQRDAMQFGSASIIVAGGWESYHAMQKEQRAMQKELRAASGWIYPKQDPTEIQRLVDQQDAYLGQWFNNANAGCYLLPKTPDGTVEC